MIPIWYVITSHGQEEHAEPYTDWDALRAELRRLVLAGVDHRVERLFIGANGK